MSMVVWTEETMIPYTGTRAGMDRREDMTLGVGRYLTARNLLLGDKSRYNSSDIHNSHLDVAGRLPYVSQVFLHHELHLITLEHIPRARTSVCISSQNGNTYLVCRNNLTSLQVFLLWAFVLVNQHVMSSSTHNVATRAYLFNVTTPMTA